MVTMVTMVTVSRCCNEYFISVKYYGESSSQFQNFNFLKAVPLAVSCREYSDNH